MENLLNTVTEKIDKFCEKSDIKRLAAIIGGEAVILHGIPRTTLDVDILLFFEHEKNYIFYKEFVSFLQEELKERFEVKYFKSAKDLSDPIKHDLIIITCLKNRFKKLDILIANYKWEVEGLMNMDSPYKGKLQPYPKSYLTVMKLMAGGSTDDEDIRNLFLIMSDSEKEKAFELARLIRRDKNLAKILSQGKRR